MINSHYYNMTKTINNNILESVMSMASTPDEKILYMNTIDSETHILNLDNNMCEKIITK